MSPARAFCELLAAAELALDAAEDADEAILLAADEAELEHKQGRDVSLPAASQTRVPAHLPAERAPDAADDAAEAADEAAEVALDAADEAAEVAEETADEAADEAAAPFTLR